MSSFNKPAPDGHFVRDPDEGLLRHILSHSSYLEAHLAGPDSGNPETGFAFAFAHSGFQRL